MSILTNRALWQDACGVPGVIRDSSPPTNDTLGTHKVLVKVHAWAINPCDHMLQDRNMVNYPLILGCDVAGTVEAISSGTAASSEFRIGDRVFGFGANYGFQDYVTLEDKLVAKIPDAMSYRDASVLGLCSATSAMFLFGKDYLNLDYPRVGNPKKGKTILVWGGSSAVGSNAIQLATAAGYDVVATGSAKNSDYIRGLGATHVFDYKGLDVTEKIVNELDKRECAGIFMAAGLEDGNAAVCKVAAASKQKIPIASSSFISNVEEIPEGIIIRQPTANNFKPFPDCWFETINATFGGYLPWALANGDYQVAPPPLTVNKDGLEGIQEAIDLMRVITEQGKEAANDALKRLEKNENKGELSAMKLVVERS